MMKDVSQEAVECFVQACHQVAGCGLVRCSSGNLSMRVAGDRCLVKASRSWMARAVAADVSICRISDGALLEGPKPSVEIGFHAGILRTRPEVNVVLHFQAPYATVLACHKPKTINYFVIPEMPFYVGPVARVPYLPPGSRELAQAVTEAMRTHDLVVLTNHGQVTVADDVDHAIQKAMFFELASEIVLCAGDDLVTIPEEGVEALLDLRRAVKGNV